MISRLIAFRTLFTLLLAACYFALLSCQSAKSDAEIQRDVETRLQGEPESAGLTASVTDGVVTLSGECNSIDCRKQCEEKVGKIAGVDRVINNISVASPRPDQPQPGEVLSDEAIRAGVSEALRGIEKVQAEVNDGVVTLTGEISKSDLDRVMASLHTLRPRSIRQDNLVVK